MKTTPHRISFTNAQTGFFGSSQKIVGFIGGVGAGKTYIHCWRAIKSALAGRKYCLVSFSYGMLRDVIVPTLKEIILGIGFKWDYNKVDNIVTIGQGMILLRSADNPDSLRGINAHDGGIDEACYCKPEILDVLLARLRKAHDSQLFITTTPKGGKKSWVYNALQQDDAESFRQSTIANPHLPESYIKTLLKNYTTKMIQQEIYADWVDFGGGIIEREWLPITTQTMNGALYRSWDFAVTVKKHSDYSAGVKVCISEDEELQVQDVIRGKWKWPELREMIINTAEVDGPEVEIICEESGQQAALVDDLMNDPRMHSYSIHAVKPKGDKNARAMPWISRAERGRMSLLHGQWNDEFIEEAASFTADDTHANDDQLDPVSQAWQFHSQPVASIGYL